MMTKCTECIHWLHESLQDPVGCQRCELERVERTFDHFESAFSAFEKVFAEEFVIGVADLVSYACPAERELHLMRGAWHEQAIHARELGFHKLAAASDRVTDFFRYAADELYGKLCALDMDQP